MATFDYVEVNGDPLGGGPLLLCRDGTADIVDRENAVAVTNTSAGLIYQVRGHFYKHSNQPLLLSTGTGLEVYQGWVGGAAVRFAYLPQGRDRTHRVVLLEGLWRTGQAVNDISLFDSSQSQSGDPLVAIAAGALVETRNGPHRIEQLRRGDRVATRDHGLQPIRWIGRKRISGARLMATPNIRPVRISRDALELGLPTADLLVSPRHRLLLASASSLMHLGEPEVLVPVEALINGKTIKRVDGLSETAYYHLLFDTHEIICVNGVDCESLHPGATGLGPIDEGPRNDLMGVFPELLSHPNSYGPPARRALSDQETKAMMRRPTVFSRAA